MNPKLALLNILMLVVFSMSSSAQDVPQPVMSQSAAIQAARDFCSKIGVSISDTAEAVFPRPTLPFVPENSYLNHWLVTFTSNGARVKVSVIDSIGAVDSYSNMDVAGQDDPGGDGISEAEAIQRATAVLQYLALTGDLVFNHAERDADIDPEQTWTDHSWSVTWQRQFQGIPYRDQEAIIALHSHTGAIRSIYISTNTPAPAFSGFGISRAQADTIAANQIAAAGIQNAVLDLVLNEVVQPNNYWRLDLPMEQRWAEPTPGLARVAYVYMLSTPDDNYYDVWIDAENGAVLGGEWSTDTGIKLKPKPKLQVRKALKEAREIRIYRRGPKGKWESKPTASLTRDVNSRLFALVKSARPCKNSGPLAEADFKIVLVKKKGLPAVELVYLSRNGRLGKETQWAAVPPAFRTWVSRFKPKAVAAGPRK